MRGGGWRSRVKCRSKTITCMSDLFSVTTCCRLCCTMYTPRLVSGSTPMSGLHNKVRPPHQGRASHQGQTSTPRSGLTPMSDLHTKVGPHTKVTPPHQGEPHIKVRPPHQGQASAPRSGLIPRSGPRTKVGPHTKVRPPHQCQIHVKGASSSQCP